MGECVLIVEGSDLARHRIRTALQQEGRAVHTATSVRDGLGALGRLRPNLIVVGLEHEDLPGDRVVDLFVKRGRGAPVVAAGATSDVSDVVAAMRRGAVDFLAAHDEPDELRRKAEGALHGGVRGLEEQRRPAPADRFGFRQLLTQSRRMITVFDQIRRVARTDATALILGETGTGKELVSRAIHDKSHRQDQPFIGVNCGAFTQTLLESELFGHEKGSFTGAVARREGLFEMANGGTLFLDELGETSLNVQVKLLRVLEEMQFRRVGGREPVEVDVRIVAATNADLEAAVAAGDFREDLFYRLNVFPIRLPPLRERPEDIPLLMRHFLDEIAESYELQPPSIAPSAMKAILRYAWPGNVRELRAMCERWVIARAGQRVDCDLLPNDMIERKATLAAPGTGYDVDEHLSLKDNVTRATEQVERAYLSKVLERCSGHLGNTADEAGITRRTLYTKMRQYGLEQADFRASARDRRR